MSEKLNFELPVTDRMVIFTDQAPAELRGKKLQIYSDKGFPNMYLKFDAKINLTEKTLCRNGEPEYDNFDGQTLNQLVAEGIIREWSPFKQVYFRDVLNDPRYTKTGKSPDYERIIEEVKAMGMNVSKKALTLVYRAWKEGFKVGHVDRRNKVFVFAPSGMLNPLSYSISELHPTASDWQIDYLC